MGYIRFILLAFAGAWMAPVIAEDTTPQQAVPTVVEVFTSTLCPSCPGVEAKLADKAAEDPRLLVVLENVTYWDRGGDEVDPHGNADLTQRQYDYSNILARRPGEVFTPQPILNGVRVASPPLWLSWDGALAQTRAEPAPAPLAVERYETGGFAVTVPKGVSTKNLDLWVMGIVREENGLYRAESLANVPVRGSRVLVPARSVPRQGSQVLMLLQESGPGRIVALALSQPRKMH